MHLLCSMRKATTTNKKASAKPKQKPTAKKTVAKKPVAKPKKVNDVGLTNSDKKAYAFDLFMNTDYTQKRICELVGVSEKTFGSWKNNKADENQDWDQLKSATQITSKVIERNVYKRLAELTAEGKAFQADQLIKAAKTIEILRGDKITLSQTINVFKGYTTFLFDKNPELAKQNNIYQQEYINQLLKD